MKTIQSITDTFAVGFSVTCALHCLFTPLLITVVPAVAGTALEDEAFHFWLVLAVVPTSVIALASGCRLHGRLGLVAFAGLGILVLLSPFMLGHEIVTPALEKGLTLLGSAIVATVHIMNFRLCRQACAYEADGKEAVA